MGNFLKPLATIILPKSPTFLGIFCKGVKIYHFSSVIIFGQLLLTIWRFFSDHTGTNCVQVDVDERQTTTFLVKKVRAVKTERKNGHFLFLFCQSEGRSVGWLAAWIELINAIKTLMGKVVLKIDQWSILSNIL